MAAGYDFDTSVSMAMDNLHGMQGVYGANTPLQRVTHMVVNKRQVSNTHSVHWFRSLSMPSA